MKHYILVIVALVVGGVYWSYNKSQAGTCKNSTCYVLDLTNNEVIIVNNWVIEKCKFVDSATVACPK